MTRNISNINRRECWSCKYYAGSRDYKGRLFVVDEKGQCLERRGNNRDGSTIYSWYCSHYRRAGDVEACIQNKEAEKEIERKKREVDNYQRQQNEKLKRQIQYQKDQIYQENEKLKKQIQNEKDQIDQERLRLESERKRLEHERWLNSLSPEEREKYFAEQKRKAELKEWEEKSQARINQKLSGVKTKLKEVEEIRKKAKKEKRKPFVGLISFLIITLVCFGLGWIPYLSNLNNAEKNESLANLWVQLGHSTDSEEYLEWMVLAEQFRSKANEVLYIPYLILGILLIVTIITTILLFIWRKKKLEVFENNFNKSKSDALKLAQEAEDMTKEKMKIYKEIVEKKETTNKNGLD